VDQQGEVEKVDQQGEVEKVDQQVEVEGAEQVEVDPTKQDHVGREIASPFPHIHHTIDSDW